MIKLGSETEERAVVISDWVRSDASQPIGSELHGRRSLYRIPIGGIAETGCVFAGGYGAYAPPLLRVVPAAPLCLYSDIQEV